MERLANWTKVLLTALFTALLLVSFVVLGLSVLNASTQLLSSTQALVDKTGLTGAVAEKAIELQTTAYSAVVKEVISPLLNALLAGFLAYVVGKTVGTVSFNLTEAKKGTDAKPKQLELF
jgi:hypothetical protein